MSASIWRSRRQVGIVATNVWASPGSTSSGCGAVAPRTLVPGGAGSVDTPTRSRIAACSDAGEADEAQGIAPVRLHVDVQHDVAVHLRQADADRRLGRQDEDPVGVRGQIELVAGAEHPIADDTHLLG